MASRGRGSSRMQPDRKRKSFKNNLWRQNVYEMGNMQEGQGFAAKRKLSVIREYKKFQRKNQHESADAPVIDYSKYEEESDSETEVINNVGTNTKKTKLTTFQKAKEEFERQQDEKRKKIEERELAKKEKKAALKRYRQKKMAKMKILNKKTAKGQPALRARMDLILDEIREQIRKE